MGGFEGRFGLKLNLPIGSSGALRLCQGVWWDGRPMGVRPGCA